MIFKLRLYINNIFQYLLFRFFKPWQLTVAALLRLGVVLSQAITKLLPKLSRAWRKNKFLSRKLALTQEKWMA